MSGEYLTRGVKVGTVVGPVFGLPTAVAANPPVGYVDDLNHATTEESGYTREAESAHSRETEGTHSHEFGDSHAGESGGHHDTTISIAVTKVMNIITGGLWDVVLSDAFFGIVLFFLESATPGPDATKSYLMEFMGFITASSAPRLVFPPAVPGAEQSLSTATRLPFYTGMMLTGALVCLSADYVCTRLRESRGLGVALAGATVPFGLFAVLAVVIPESAIRRTLSSALETGLTGLFAFEQVLPWLVLAVVHARFRPSSESKSESGTPTAGRDLAPAAD